MGRIAEWALDWFDRSGVKPSGRRIDDPITLLQRSFAALAGIIAVLSNPAVSVLAPHLNANAVVVLRALIAFATLVAVNYVVTAKDVIHQTAGFKVQTLRTYRFSTTERLIARGVVAIALLIFALNLVPDAGPSRNCELTATLDWQPDGSARPMFLSLAAADHTDRYGTEQGQPIAMQLRSVRPTVFSIVLEWSDGSRSDFGAFSGCSAVADRRSKDGRAKVHLVVR